ncbi:unnamed protein product [Amoebophrya sp. A25]|nr:unnamed protein product [Amoebophrya sp. A25]|eukprot:GSA25T00004653001.1
MNVQRSENVTLMEGAVAGIFIGTLRVLLQYMSGPSWAGEIDETTADVDRLEATVCVLFGRRMSRIPNSSREVSHSIDTRRLASQHFVVEEEVDIRQQVFQYLDHELESISRGSRTTSDTTALANNSKSLADAPVDNALVNHCLRAIVCYDSDSIY